MSRIRTESSVERGSVPTTFVEIIEASSNGSDRFVLEIRCPRTGGSDTFELSHRAEFDSEEDFGQMIAELIQMWDELVDLKTAGPDACRVLKVDTSVRACRRRRSAGIVPTDYSADVDAACDRLASEGLAVFERIFGTLEDPSNELARKLYRTLAAADRQHLKIRTTTGKCRVPWTLLYAQPDDVGDPAAGAPLGKTTWKGFWGYGHVINHVESTGRGTRWGISAPFHEALPKVETRVYANRNVKMGSNGDTDRKISADDHVARIDKLAHYDNTNIWEAEHLLQRLLEDGTLGRLSYFYCHGRGAGDVGSGEIELTDQTIRVQRLKNALRKSSRFNDEPLVFLNACENAQMYQDLMGGAALGSLFLNRGAKGLIGPLTRIPILFAAEFSERVLELWATHLHDGESGQEFRRLTTVLNEVTREYIDQHGYPLGLLYAVYRAGDCYLVAT